MEIEKERTVLLSVCENDLKASVTQLLATLANHSVTAPEKYLVADCKIETEEYIDENIAKYTETREGWADEVATMGIKRRKLQLTLSPTTNRLVKQAKDNLRDIRAASLAAILKTRSVELVCKDSFAQHPLYKYINAELQGGMRRRQKNALNPALVPLFRFGSNNHTFVRFSVHSSINHKKINELFARTDCTLAEVAEAISCHMRMMQFKVYTRFFFFEEHFVYELRPDAVCVGEEEVLAKIAREKLKVRVSLLDETVLRDIEVEFNRRYIYRDCTSCDHILIFSDMVYCDLGELRIVNTFTPRWKKEKCRGCEDPAEYLAHNSAVSTEAVC